MKPAVLVCLSLVFGWTAFRSAGVEPSDWYITVVALAILTPLALRGSSAPPLSRWLAWPLLLLPAWVIGQIVPLPAALVRIISPARAELARALGDSQWISLSACPAETLRSWMVLAGAVLAFFIARELACHYSDRAPWVVILPLVIVASLEAGLGLVQAYSGAADTGAHGTYRSRDHFAGLIEMALPFPVMYAYQAWRRGRRRFASPLRPAAVACGSLAVAALLLLAAVESLSRMGFVAAIFALGVLGAAALPGKRWLLLAPVAAILLLVFLPPDRLIERFAELAAADKVTSDYRLELWRETLPMISSYAATGSGLGSFEFAFPRFKRTAPLIVDNFAHNDYLQYLAELGVIGFSLGLGLLSAVLKSAGAAASRHSSVEGRALALACIASLTALLLHSLVDFNTYIPANLFACAWISALGVSVLYSSNSPSPAILVLKRK